jgi:hypothetical protein
LRGWITAVGLVLAVAIGLIGGILLQQYVNFDTVQRRLERARTRAAYDARRSDPKQWAIDSTRWAASALRLRDYRPPREIAWQQAAENCAVSFEFRDTLAQHMQLLKVSAWDRMYPGTVIAEGWGFSRSGFRIHDTVSVVLPKVWCGDIVIGGHWATLLVPDSLRLNVR